MICNLIATTTSSISVPIPILHPKNLFFLPSPSFLSSSSSQQQIPRRLLNRFPVRHLSCSSTSLKSCGRTIKENEYNLRVSVLWDFESCDVPSGVSYSKVAPSITGALRTNGLTGPIHIQAYGNVYKLSETNQQILHSSGVVLRHFPGGRTRYYRFLMDWMSQNPRGPAHLFLITGERGFGFICTVRRLSNSNYKILFACPGVANVVICCSSIMMWQWSKILEGKFLQNIEDMTFEDSTSFAPDP